MAAPPAKACQAAPLIELASVENGGGGLVRFREGDFVSQPVGLDGSPQPIVFPRERPETAPLKELIIIEGDATNLVLGGEGDHFVIPRVDGSDPEYDHLVAGEEVLNHATTWREFSSDSWAAAVRPLAAAT